MFDNVYIWDSCIRAREEKKFFFEHTNTLNFIFELIFDRLLNNNQLNQLPSGIFSNYTRLEWL